MTATRKTKRHGPKVGRVNEAAVVDFVQWPGGNLQLGIDIEQQSKMRKRAIALGISYGDLKDRMVRIANVALIERGPQAALREAWDFVEAVKGSKWNPIGPKGKVA